MGGQACLPGLVRQAGRVRPRQIFPRLLSPLGFLALTKEEPLTYRSGGKGFRFSRSEGRLQEGHVLGSEGLRWKQRYANLQMAYTLLSETVGQVQSLSVLEKEGMVQRFEYTFDLTWKTVKYYLEAQGVEAKFPREVIRLAFQYEIFEDGDVWMDMLEKRNLMAHTYDEAHFLRAVKDIAERYYPAISRVMAYLERQG